MYRDTEGGLRWEGKFRTKGNAQTRLSEVLIEIHKGTYLVPDWDLNVARSVPGGDVPPTGIPMFPVVWSAGSRARLRF